MQTIRLSTQKSFEISRVHSEQLIWDLKKSLRQRDYRHNTIVTCTALYVTVTWNALVFHVNVK